MDSFANARPSFVLACLPHADSEPEPTFRVISTCDEFSASLPYLIDVREVFAHTCVYDQSQQQQLQQHMHA